MHEPVQHLVRRVDRGDDGRGPGALVGARRQRALQDLPRAALLAPDENVSGRDDDGSGRALMGREDLATARAAAAVASALGETDGR